MKRLILAWFYNKEFKLHRDTKHNLEGCVFCYIQPSLQSKFLKFYE